MQCVIPNRMKDRKPIISGLDYIWYDSEQNIALAAGSLGGAMRIASSIMPKDLKRSGFKPVIFETRDYYRLNYSK